MSTIDFPFKTPRGPNLIFLQTGMYDVDPTGVSDSTAGMQAFANDCAATGAQGFIGPGNFLMSAPWLLGNGTNTTRSAPLAIVGAGGMVEGAVSPAGVKFTAAPQISSIRAATTLVAAPGFVGSSMISYRGPGEVILTDIAIQCSGIVANGLIAQSSNKSTFARLSAFSFNGGAGFNFKMNDTYTGGWGDETQQTRCDQLHALSPIAGSIGCVVGSPTRAQILVNNSFWLFTGCNFDTAFLSAGANVGLQLQYVDNLTFVQTFIAGNVAGGGASLKIVPPTGAGGTSFPTGITFLDCSTNGDAPVFPSAAAWAPGLGGIKFINWHTDNGQSPLPWDARIDVSAEGGQLWANARANAPFIASIAPSNAVTNTIAETVMAQLGPLRMVAGMPSIRGTAMRLRCGGLYTCTNTNGLTLRLRAYFGDLNGASFAGNLFFDTGAIALGNARTNYTWLIDLEVLAFGVSQVNCRNAFYAAENTLRPMNTGQSATYNVGDLFTTVRSIVVTAQWSIAEAGDAIAMDGATTLDVSPPGIQPVG